MSGTVQCTSYSTATPREQQTNGRHACARDHSRQAMLRSYRAALVARVEVIDTVKDGRGFIPNVWVRAMASAIWVEPVTHTLVVDHDEHCREREEKTARKRQLNLDEIRECEHTVERPICTGHAHIFSRSMVGSRTSSASRPKRLIVKLDCHPCAAPSPSNVVCTFWIVLSYS
jgi:hypothetical protein